MTLPLIPASIVACILLAAGLDLLRRLGRSV